MQDRLKILFVLEHFHPYIGGAETLFKQLTTELVKRGHHIEVLSSLYDKELEAVETFEGVIIHRVRCKSRFDFTFKSIPKAIKMARSFDLIHCTSYTAAIPARIAALFSGKPVSITFHELWARLWYKLPYLNQVQKLSFYLFEQLVVSLKYDCFVAVSDYTRQALQSRRPNSKVIRIYNGINYQEFEKYRWKETPKKHFLFLGRLGVSKGINLLIGSLKMINDQTIKFTIVLPKEPIKLSEKIRREISEAQTGAEVEILSGLKFDKVLKLFSEVTAVLIPSYSEGFGFVGVEAKAVGVPVIHSNQGALKETIGGEQILLEDMSAQALHRAIEKAISGNWQIGAHKRFELHETIDKYEDLFQQLVK